MSRVFRKRTKKLGLPPGTLVHVGEESCKEVTLNLIEYDHESCIIKENASIEECLKSMERPSTSWINVTGIHDPSTIEGIGRPLGLHPLLLEDILTTSQRSKLDDYKSSIYIVMGILHYDIQKQDVVDEQLSLVLGENFLISFLECDINIFDPIISRLETKHSRMRSRGADYLCYALADTVVDQYFMVLELVDDQLEVLENELIYNPNPNTPRKIQNKKREIMLLRRSVWPLRETISRFQRIDSPLIKESTKVYVQDIYDHVIQAIDTVESFRDISAGMLDIYMSNMSQKMNEIMKVLTIVATVFVPLTFIASIYGMNFKYMPELDWQYGYTVTLVVMASIAGMMLIFFKRRGWM